MSDSFTEEYQPGRHNANIAYQISGRVMGIRIHTRAVRVICVLAVERSKQRQLVVTTTLL